MTKEDEKMTCTVCVIRRPVPDAGEDSRPVCDDGTDREMHRAGASAYREFVVKASGKDSPIGKSTEI